MSMDNNKKQGLNIKRLVGVFIVFFLGLPIIFLLSIERMSDKEFQTMLIALFASLETIVSAFAFFGLIKSLQLQREDLQLQREEMTETRKVFEDQKMQMELQNEQLKKESINNEFYTRYKLFLDVIGSMRYQESNQELFGRSFLTYIGNDYNNYSFRDSNGNLNINGLSLFILSEYGSKGLYWFFSSLNNLITWCENQPNAKELINIILDEFIPIEKRVIYYSVFFNDRFTNLRQRLLDIGFIESLTKDVYLSEEHYLNPPHASKI